MQRLRRVQPWLLGVLKEPQQRQVQLQTWNPLTNQTCVSHAKYQQLKNLCWLTGLCQPEEPGLGPVRVREQLQAVQKLIWVAQ